MTTTLPLFPLSRPLFPDGALSLRVFEIRYLNMIRRCIDEQSEFGVVLLLEGSEVRSPTGRETLATAGTRAKITEWQSPVPALFHIQCLGTTRFQLLNAHQEDYGLWVGNVLELPQAPAETIPEHLQAAADRLQRLLNEIKQDSGPVELPIAQPYRFSDCGWVADRWGELLPMSAADRQRLLTMQNPVRRLETVFEQLKGRGLV
ncbi:MAG TPA: LON peptidase substrate-binding domain-containing protein [Burkholderiaceae bacterium]|nr:LON peptidase substrate-binding domain-containing protein [Burkholderiaceae bacterium]